MPATPRFRLDTTLLRYVKKSSGNGSVVAAFLLRRAIGEKSLSVNSTDFEAQTAICRYYAQKWETGVRHVNVSSVRISKYNAAAEEAGVAVKYDDATTTWVFANKVGKSAAAYVRSPRDGSPSHCGVEFLAHLDELSEMRFARRMADYALKKVRL